MHFKVSRRLKDLYDRFSNSKKPSNREFLESIHALVNLSEARDPDTKRHSVKVSSYAVLLAKHIGLSKEELEAIKLSAVLHDIGKIGIKQKVLLKNGALTKKEYEDVKKHCEIGIEVIKPFKFFNKVIPIIKHHHEDYDGTGYPDGLKGENIPLGSRILAIADTYDALTSKRAYRKAFSPREAVKIMRKESGRRFDPELLEGFIKCLAK